MRRWSRSAVEARDVQALLNAGETLDAACESAAIKSHRYRVAPTGDAGSVRK
ncbi:MAG: hypothetical protein U0Q11_18535 [Vicinamibacterales bacterium]